VLDGGFFNYNLVSIIFVTTLPFN